MIVAFLETRCGCKQQFAMHRGVHRPPPVWLMPLRRDIQVRFIATDHEIIDRGAPQVREFKLVRYDRMQEIAEYLEVERHDH